MCKGNNLIEDIGIGFEKTWREFGKGMEKITGAEAAAEANDIAREQIKQQQADALKEREDAKAQVAAEQLAASRGAAPTRTTGTSTSTSATPRYSQLGDEERDFLGL